MNCNRVLVVFLLLLLQAFAAQAQEAERFFCRWEPTGLFYEVTIDEQQDGKYLVCYTMDGTTEWVPHCRVGKYKLSPGFDVEVKWWKDKLYYLGTITAVNGDNINIRWHDGGAEDQTPISQIRVKAWNSQGKQIGEDVLGRWPPNGYWYPGRIEEIQEGKYRVVYFAGDESWLPAEHVLPYLPTFRDRVEAKWSRDGLYYQAKIIGRNGHNVRVRWNDGTSEEREMSHLRVSPGQLPTWGIGIR